MLLFATIFSNFVTNLYDWRLFFVDWYLCYHHYGWTDLEKVQGGNIFYCDLATKQVSVEYG